MHINKDEREPLVATAEEIRDRAPLVRADYAPSTGWRKETPRSYEGRAEQWEAY